MLFREPGKSMLHSTVFIHFHMEVNPIININHKDEILFNIRKKKKKKSYLFNERKVCVSVFLCMDR